MALPRTGRTNCHAQFGERCAVPLPIVARQDPRVITVQRSTVVRIGVVLLVLAALGVGTAIGLTVGSKSSPSAKSTAPGASTTSKPVSTTSSTSTSSTTAAPEPAVLSCGPLPTPHVRPTTLTVGCATRTVTVTGITWNEWDGEAGGQGTGTVNQGFENAPAIVVVFHAVNGIFQDITVTPTKDASSTPPTTTPPTGGPSHFDHSSDNDDDRWWHRPGRSVTARFRVGWKLRTSSLQSDSKSLPGRSARRVRGSARTHARGGVGSARSPRDPTVAGPAVADRKTAVISFRRSTVVRIGVGASVLAALTVGFAFGWAISSPSHSTATNKVVTDAATTPTSAPPAGSKASSPTTPATLVPTVAACQPGGEPQVRPTSIAIGCDGHISMSNVTWSSWGASTASGSGSVTVNSCQPNCATGSGGSSPAFVVVSDPVGGVYQDVLITPPTGDIAPQSSSHPGSAWGSG